MMQIRIQKACSKKKRKEKLNQPFCEEMGWTGMIYLHHCVSVTGWRRPSEVERQPCRQQIT